MTHEKKIIFKLSKEEEEAVRVFTELVRDGLLITDEEDDADAYANFDQLSALLDWFDTRANP